MKTETFEGQIDSYQGKTLTTPIKFTGSVDVYENVAEAKTAGAWPNELDILETMNAKLITGAKAREYQASTKDLKVAYEKSSEFLKKQMVNALVAGGFSQEEAEALAGQKIK